MLHEKKIRASIRKIIRKAKQNNHTLITVAGSDNEYDSDPAEIVCDCTDNAYTHNLIKGLDL